MEVVHKKINLADDRYKSWSMVNIYTHQPLPPSQPGLGARALLHPAPTCVHPVRAWQGTDSRAFLHPGHQCQLKGLGRQHQGCCRGPCLQPLPPAGRKWLSGPNALEKHPHNLVPLGPIVHRIFGAINSFPRWLASARHSSPSSHQLACWKEFRWLPSLFEFSLNCILLQKWSSP